MRSGTGLPRAPRAVRKPRAQPEFLMQSAVFEWARIPSVQKQYQGIELLEGSMNGVKLTAAQAGKAKAAGMLKGSHDVRLPIARGGYLGLSIELKAGKNKPSEEQISYGIKLTAEGWKVLYIWDDWIQVKHEIIAYITQLDMMQEAGFCHACGGAKTAPVRKSE